MTGFFIGVTSGDSETFLSLSLESGLPLISARGS